MRFRMAKFLFGDIQLVYDLMSRITTLQTRSPINAKIWGKQMSRRVASRLSTSGTAANRPPRQFLTTKHVCQSGRTDASSTHVCLSPCLSRLTVSCVAP